MKNYYILVYLLLIVFILPVSAGTATLAWFNTTGNATTSIDTNIDGTIFFVGFVNGTIIAFNATVNSTTNMVEAIPIWSNQTNSTLTGASANLIKVKKIISDDNGNIVWINNQSQAGFITYAGIPLSRITNTSNFTDITMRSDAGAYATTELRSGVTPSRIRIYNPDGTVYAQNVSFGTNANWTRIVYDPNNQWLITANESSNRLYYWCITTWNGWEQFNPTHTASKNASQQYIDSFPYRGTINITYDGGTKGINFVNNTTNTSTVIRINNSLYQYNRLNLGSYFWWARTGNLTNVSNLSEQPENGLLNLSLVSGENYYVVFKPISGLTNYTFYFGNASTVNTITSQSWINNGTLFRQNFSGSGTFTPPTSGGGVTAVNLTMYGGGGGAACGYSYGNGANGAASALTQINNVLVTPGTGYSVTIGGAGDGCLVGVHGPANGGTTIFNNGTAQNAVGGTAAAGGTQNGNTTIPGFPIASSGTSGQVYCGAGCCLTPSAPNAGGTGYGAGGGGGGAYYDSGGLCVGVPGSGGNGATGVAQVSYYINDVPVYYYGAAPTSTLNSVDSRQSSVALNQSAVKDYVGPVVGLHMPTSGSLVSISTDTSGGVSGVFYQQYVSQSGFGVAYCGTSQGLFTDYPGTPNDVKASNSLWSIEGRSTQAVVYASDGVVRALTGSGGAIRSVDIAMTSGLLAVFGGDDSKVYMLNRIQSTSQWLAYFTGSGTSPITGIAVTWNGEAVVVCRQDGTIEYYLTNATVPVVPTPSFIDAQLRVYKDGNGYANQPVTIYSSTATNPYVWAPVSTSYTDGSGVLTYTTTSGVYYKFVVNNVVGTTSGEGEVIWQSNAVSTVVQIFILSASTPYEWNAYYSTPVNNVTVLYSDSITPASVTVTIKDLKSNLVVLTKTEYNNPSFTIQYHDQLGNGTYQVNIVINRLGGVAIRDQRIVTSPNTYGSILPNDEYITWAISTFVLMLIAGMFSYSNSKRGALAVVVVAGVFMIFKLLPATMVTVAMLAAIFAVMSLFASRVQ